MNKAEGVFTLPYILREQRLQSTPLPEWFEMTPFRKQIKDFYRRVTIQLGPLRWGKRYTQELAQKHALLESLRIYTTNDPEDHLFFDRKLDREFFYHIVTEDIISIFLSCIDFKSITLSHLANLASIIDRILLDPELFNAPLHKNILLSFGSWVEYHTREFDGECVKDKLRKACRDCGIEDPDVLE